MPKGLDRRSPKPGKFDPVHLRLLGEGLLGVEFRVLEFRVKGVAGSKLLVLCFAALFRVYSLGFRIWVYGFRV